MRLRLINNLPSVCILVLILVGLMTVAVGPWRQGVAIIGGATAAGGLLRLVLPDQLAGILRVRSRLGDSTCLVLAGVAIIVLAVIIPPSPQQ